MSGVDGRWIIWLDIIFGAQRLVANIAGAMQSVPREIQVRQIGHFMKADPAYGEAITKGLGIDTADIN